MRQSAVHSDWDCEKLIVETLYLGPTGSCFKIRIVANAEEWINIDERLITALILKGWMDIHTHTYTYHLRIPQDHKLLITLCPGSCRRQPRVKGCTHLGNFCIILHMRFAHVRAAFIPDPYNCFMPSRTCKWVLVFVISVSPCDSLKSFFGFAFYLPLQRQNCSVVLWFVHTGNRLQAENEHTTRCWN